MTADTLRDREAIGALPNPLGLDGIEFIEYATSRPQALGQVLEMMGFRPVARHRSREVLLYRQGGMNVVIDAHSADRPAHHAPTEVPTITAIALRVRDAAAAYQRALDRGAWAVPTQVAVMELNIPAIHGVGASRLYFVDRYKDFSIWDVDFVPIPTVDRQPAGAGRAALVRHRAVHRQRPAGRLDRLLPRTVRLRRTARRPALRHPAQGPHPAQPLPQLLSAADRARAGHRRGRGRRMPAAHGPGHA